jgi:4-diphosphocytidyl-2-C-methyl-D-erythritol kinase
MSALRALAPAKINLGLFIGPTRAGDGRHELVSVMQSISLADELTLTDAPPGATEDEILCPGVEGDPRENLAARALGTFRQSTGWDGPPWRLTIAKRIPVAAGLGGGSADAAAALRLAHAASGLGDEELLLELAGGLGADVPAQVTPGRWLAAGAGEGLEELAPPVGSLGVLVLPVPVALSTAAVYREADRLGLTCSEAELAERRAALRDAYRHGPAIPAALELLGNDLQRAAVSLCPQIAPALREARAAGAAVSMVSGSGPTVLGLFPGSAATHEPGSVLAEQAAARLRGREPAAVWAEPVAGSFAAPLVA